MNQSWSRLNVWSEIDFFPEIHFVDDRRIVKYTASNYGNEWLFVYVHFHSHFQLSPSALQPGVRWGEHQIQLDQNQRRAVASCESLEVIKINNFILRPREIRNGCGDGYYFFLSAGLFCTLLPVTDNARKLPRKMWKMRKNYHKNNQKRKCLSNLFHGGWCQVRLLRLRNGTCVVVIFMWRLAMGCVRSDISKNYSKIFFVRTFPRDSNNFKNPFSGFNAKKTPLHLYIRVILQRNPFRVAALNATRIGKSYSSIIHPTHSSTMLLS